MALGHYPLQVILDPMVVGPQCSYPMDQICTPPLHFLWSLDSDLMDIGFSGLVIQCPLSLLLLSLCILPTWKNF
jgi:hypothetical protein